MIAAIDAASAVPDAAVCPADTVSTGATMQVAAACPMTAPPPKVEAAAAAAPYDRFRSDVSWSGSSPGYGSNRAKGPSPPSKRGPGGCGSGAAGRGGGSVSQAPGSPGGGGASAA